MNNARTTRQIFISYSREDSEVTDQIVKGILSNGFTIWRDVINVGVSEIWPNTTNEALISCSRMILILSKSSVKSREVQAEWFFFRSNNKPIHCLLIEDCELPFQLMPYHRIDGRTNLNDAIEKLIASLPRRLKEDSNDGELIYNETLPAHSKVFIGRADEQYEFQQALSTITSPQSLEAHTSFRNVFLLRGEGGWGKSTLLSQFIESCELHSAQIYWLYIDWEKAAVGSQKGTAAMMKYIVSTLEEKYPDQINCKRFHEQYKLLYEEVAEGIDDSRQLKLSQCFVFDMIQITYQRPIVFLLDTWEVVHGFADEWLRNGFLQHSLTNPHAGRKLLFVVAGRFPYQSHQKYWDAVRRFTHERGLYDRELMSFTSLDIFTYFKKHPDFGVDISDKSAEAIRELTYGIPLAVEIMSTMIYEEYTRERVDINRSINIIIAELRKTSGQTVIELLSARFLRHLESQNESDKKHDYLCIASFALMRPEEITTDSRRKLGLLRQIWTKLGLLKNSKEFWSLLYSLQNRYSFLFAGVQMHTEVYKVLRKVVINDIFTTQIAVEAAKLCRLNRMKRERTLTKESEDRRSQPTPYEDREWQEWIIDESYYRLLSDNVDDALQDYIMYYIQSKHLGIVNMSNGLMDLTQNDSLISEKLTPYQRKLLAQVFNFKEWFSDSKMEDERNRFINTLRVPERITAFLLAACSAFEQQKYDIACHELEQAHKIYHTLMKGSNDIKIKEQIGECFLKIGKSMGKLSRKLQLKGVSLGLLEKAKDYEPDNPYIKWSLAEILISVDRYAEAEIELQGSTANLTEARYSGVIDQNPRLLAMIAEKSTTTLSRIQSDKHSMAKASLFSSQGAFKEAREIFLTHLKYEPFNIQLIIKYSHFLRQMGDYELSMKILEPLANSKLAIGWEATLFDAWGALHLAMNEVDKSITDYETAIKISPDYINPHYGLGRALLQKRKSIEAAIAFDEALSLKRRGSWGSKPVTSSLFWVWNGLGLAHLQGNKVNDASSIFAIAEKLTEVQLNFSSRRYQTWYHKGLSLLGQTGVDNQNEKIGEIIESLGRFDQIGQAKGFLAEILRDLNIIGDHFQTDAWKSMYSLIQSLIS